MKLLFIHPNLSRYATKQIYSLSKMKNIETFLLCGNPDVSASKTSLLQLCKEIWVDLPAIRYPGQYLMASKKISKLVDRWDFDLIMVYSMPDDIAVAATELDKVPVIYCVRDLTSTFSPELLISRIIPSQFSSGNLTGALAKHVLYKYIVSMEKKAMEKSDGRVFCTSCMLDYAKERYDISDKNLVFLNYMLKDEIPKSSKDKLSDKTGGIHIGFTGNITIYDKYRNFLPFLIKLSQKGIHVHMHVVSKHEESLNACKKASEENEYLYYYPPADPEEVINNFSAYNFGILPFENEQSYYDTIIPNKLFDYLTAGIPVISSDVKCLKRFIEENNIGFCYSDIDDLVLKLKNKSLNVFSINRNKFLMENEINRLADFCKDFQR